MKPTRTLALRRETLTDLSTDDLTAVVGGALPTTPVMNCPTLTYAQESYYWCWAPSFVPCVTQTA